MPPVSAAEPALRIGLLIADFGDGGVERTLTNLAAGLAGLGQRVDLLVGAPGHAYLRDLQATVRVWPVTGAPLPDLLAYLRAAHPDLLFTGKLSDDRTVLAARAMLTAAGEPAPLLVATVGTPLTVRGRQGGNPLTAWWERRRIGAEYRQLDGISAVSAAVAADLHRLDLGAVPVRVLANPVVPDRLDGRRGSAPHAWFTDGNGPVILAVGGLRRVKDFPTLIRALARLQCEPRPRLMILGEGRQRRALHGLITRLGLAGRVALPGFVADPYPWIASARLLALTSRREGLGNVLVEAMALGTPVVATDCPGGVRELLGNGQHGALVPVGNAQALAAAIAATLAHPPDPARLQAQAAPYRIGAAAAAYLGFFRALLGRVDGTMAPPGRPPLGGG